MSPAYRSVSPSLLGHHLGDRGAGRVGLQLHHPRVPDQGDVGVLEGGADADHLGVGLGVQRAREAVAVRAPHADAVGHVRLVDQDAARRVERVIAAPWPGHRRAAGSGARGRPRGTGRARWPAGRSDPRPARRAPGTSSRRRCSTAPCPGRRWARPARCRHGGAVRRSPRRASGTARLRTAWSRRRRSNAPAAGRTTCPSGRTSCPARRSGRRRTRPRWTSSPARGAASRRARAAGSACPRGPGGGPACRRPPRSRSR